MQDNYRLVAKLNSVQCKYFCCSPDYVHVAISMISVFQERNITDGCVPMPQVIHMERPLRCQGWCCFCCLQEVEVQSPPGTVVGYIKQDCSFVYPWFSVQNADGETVLKIKGPCWTCKWCEVEFEVHTYIRNHCLHYYLLWFDNH